MVTSLLYFRRYLTLALLLLTFVSGAWGDDFIHYRIYGSTDKWTVSQALTYKVVADNIGSVTIHLEEGAYEFFFKQPDQNNKTFYFESPIQVEDGQEYKLTESKQNNGKLTVATAGDYTFTVRWEGSTPYISVDFPFYLIVPNENVGNTERAVPASEGIAPEKHTAFKLTAGRERNQSALNGDLVSINLKIDGDKGQQLRYDKNEKIRFYIQQGEKTFRPQETENEYIIGTGDDNKKIMATNGVDFYGIRSHDMTQSAPDKYYTIHKNDAKDTKSLTFMFSRKNGPHNFKIDDNKSGSTNNGNAVNGFQNNGNLIVGFLQSRGYNSNYYKDHISKDVYLVGKMGDTYTSNKNYPMTKITYPKDASDDKADSIVYVCEVKKNNNSWDNFFLSFTTGDRLGNNGQASAHWNLLLRPHVQDQMDGQSLEGGVFFFKNDDKEDNQQQALNPLLSEDQKKRYVSYKVYFNATYSTYRIEFYDNFCIAGPAVNGIENDNTNNINYFQPKYRKAMQMETHHGVTHYTYTGEFTKGSTFAFFVNPNTYKYNYSEDDDVAGKDMWSTQAPEDKNDYAFHNHIRWNETGDNDTQSLGEGNKGILWTLPSGRYTLRLYNHKEAAGNNQLITIDKVVKLKNATSEFAESGTKKIHNYGGWRTFSDDCALWLPNGVRAFYVSEVTNEGKAKLTEVTNGIIPAHCGVLLYDENLLEDKDEEEIHLCPVPTDYSQTLPEGTTNYLVDCCNEDKTVQPIEGDKYNYFFTCFYKKIGDRGKSNVPMNFWKTVENANAKKNYTYLSVPTDIHPAAFDSNNCIYLQEPSASNIANNAKNYCFLFSLDDTFGGDTTTAIEVPEDNVLTEEGDVWFNMQGIRISKPNTPGLYIHNRKKVVIR